MANLSEDRLHCHQSISSGHFPRPSVRVTSKSRAVFYQPDSINFDDAGNNANQAPLKAVSSLLGTIPNELAPAFDRIKPCLGGCGEFYFLIPRMEGWILQSSLITENLCDPFHQSFRRCDSRSRKRLLELGCMYVQSKALDSLMALVRMWYFAQNTRCLHA